MRLIDADAAKKAVHEEFDECLVWDESGEHTANVIEEILEALPTVDTVPVVRCKDCQWYYGDYCGGFGDGSFTPEDGFCHNAERKGE